MTNRAWDNNIMQVAEPSSPNIPMAQGMDINTFASLNDPRDPNRHNRCVAPPYVLVEHGYYYSANEQRRNPPFNEVPAENPTLNWTLSLDQRPTELPVHLPRLQYPTPPVPLIVVRKHQLFTPPEASVDSVGIIGSPAVTQSSSSTDPRNELPQRERTRSPFTVERDLRKILDESRYSKDYEPRRTTTDRGSSSTNNYRSYRSKYEEKSTRQPVANGRKRSDSRERRNRSSSRERRKRRESREDSMLHHWKSRSVKDNHGPDRKEARECSFLESGYHRRSDDRHCHVSSSESGSSRDNQHRRRHRHSEKGSDSGERLKKKERRHSVDKGRQQSPISAKKERKDAGGFVQQNVLAAPTEENVVKHSAKTSISRISRKNPMKQGEPAELPQPEALEYSVKSITESSDNNSTLSEQVSEKFRPVVGDGTLAPKDLLDKHLEAPAVQTVDQFAVEGNKVDCGPPVADSCHQIQVSLFKKSQPLRSHEILQSTPETGSDPKLPVLPVTTSYQISSQWVSSALDDEPQSCRMRASEIKSFVKAFNKNLELTDDFLDESVKQMLTNYNAHMLMFQACMQSASRMQAKAQIRDAMALMCLQQAGVDQSTTDPGCSCATVLSADEVQEQQLLQENEWQKFASAEAAVCYAVPCTKAASKENFYFPMGMPALFCADHSRLLSQHAMCLLCGTFCDTDESQTGFSRCARGHVFHPSCYAKCQHKPCAGGLV